MPARTELSANRGVDYVRGQIWEGGSFLCFVKQLEATRKNADMALVTRRGQAESGGGVYQRSGAVPGEGIRRTEPG